MREEHIDGFKEYIISQYDLGNMSKEGIANAVDLFSKVNEQSKSFAEDLLIEILKAIGLVTPEVEKAYKETRVYPIVDFGAREDEIKVDLSGINYEMLEHTARDVRTSNIGKELVQLKENAKKTKSSLYTLSVNTLNDHDETLEKAYDLICKAERLKAIGYEIDYNMHTRYCAIDPVKEDKKAYFFKDRNFTQLNKDFNESGLSDYINIEEWLLATIVAEGDDDGRRK